MAAVTAQADPRSDALRGVPAGVLGPWAVLRRHRSLIARLLRRDIAARYRGSALGIGWAVITPLLMLGVYTFVFTGVLRARWGEHGATGDFAARLFLGLIIFQILARVMAESPGLLRQNSGLVKKVVFPVEVLVPVRLGSALFDALAGFLIFLAIGWLLAGPPAWSVVLAPVAAVPVALMALGTGWLLAGLGAYLTDLGPIAATAATVILFMSAIFYPIEIVPEQWRWVMHWNPVAVAIDTARGLAFAPAFFDAARFALLLVFSWLTAWAGLGVFRRVRGGFADVL
ncbi:MAG: ABC transporter permease [Phycisphaerales bacterium]|nr:ABC transporter permease [Planctomycetota bacterium]MCH8508449.1 ABC transporter permease [Phycisphaerales bacterium]